MIYLTTEYTEFTEKKKNKKTLSSVFFVFSVVLLFLIISCNRTNNTSTDINVNTEWQGARPMAILQTGEHPIWIQITDSGFHFIESIEDAIETCAFIPWPLALHVHSFKEKNDSLEIVINREGFVKISPHEQGFALYRFSGGDFWKKYTVGGFVHYEDQPAALLYLDNRFLETDAPLPNPRTWTFNMESNSPFAISIPALDLFSAQDGWDADTLRLGEDGFWYYRVSKRNALQPEIRMIRTTNLAQLGIVISAEDFFNSAPQINEANYASLPTLPEGFLYTGLARVGDSLFASWEEQHEYNIGAAGFMLIKNFN